MHGFTKMIHMGADGESGAVVRILPSSLARQRAKATCHYVNTTDVHRGRSSALLVWEDHRSKAVSEAPRGTQQAPCESGGVHAYPAPSMAHSGYNFTLALRIPIGGSKPTHADPRDYGSTGLYRRAALAVLRLGGRHPRAAQRGWGNCLTYTRR